MLELSLNGNEERWVDNTHRVFEDSPYADLQFRVKIKPISRTDISRSTKANTKSYKGVQRTDDVMMQRDLFVRCVIEWEGIVGVDKQPIECSSETKEAIANNNVGFSSLVVDAAIGYQKTVESQTDEEVGNS